MAQPTLPPDGVADHILGESKIYMFINGKPLFLQLGYFNQLVNQKILVA